MVKVEYYDVSSFGFRALEGPWDQAFCLELPFAVNSKDNFRRHRRGKGGSQSFARYADFEMSLRVALMHHVPADWDLGPELPSSLSERPQVVVVIVAPTILDAANLPKSVLDAGQAKVTGSAVLPAVLYHNDASVRAVYPSSDERTKKRSTWYLAVARLPADADRWARHSAICELGTQVLDYLEERAAS